MADLMPVVPNAPVAPVAPLGGLQPPRQVVAPVVDNPIEAIDYAITNRDTNQLKSFASKYPDSQIGKTAAELSSNIEKRRDEFAAITKDVNTQTPEGRQAALESYKAVKHNPLMGSALIAMLMGQNDTAFKMITGGAETTKAEYLPVTGRMVYKTANELGQPISVIDAETNQIIPLNEYAKQGGSISSLAETMKMKNLEEQRLNYNKKFVESTAASNARATAAAPQAQLIDTFVNGMDTIRKAGEIPNDLRAKIMGFANRNMSYGQSVSDVRQGLQNWATSKGQDVSADQKARIEAGLDATIPGAKASGGAKLNNDGSVSIGSKTYKSQSDLNQLMDSATSNKNFEEAYSQGQANLLDATQIKMLGADNYTKLMAALDAQKKMIMMNNDLDTKHGQAAYQIPVFANEKMDQAQRAIIQGMQAKFNNEAALAFDEWRNRQVELARAKDPSYVPAPGELEKNFTKTPQYRSLVQDARENTANILSQGYVESKAAGEVGGVGNISQPEKKATGKGVPPAVSPIASGRAAEAVKPPTIDRKKALEEARALHVK
jgi:hypothetical protein